MNLKDNKLKILFVSFIFVILVINLLFLNDLIQNKRYLTAYQKEYRRISSQYSYLLDHYFDNSFQKQINATILKNDFYQDYYKPRNYLLFFGFSKNNCNSCIEKEFLNIHKFSSAIGVENFVIISSNTDNIEMTAMLNACGLGGVKLINATENFLKDLIILFENRPFYFILDSQLNANMIFLPDSMNPGLTEKYFEMITKIYFSSN